MLSDYSQVPGWLFDPDPAVIRFILGEQDIRGDILEIGCNMGRTSIVLGDNLRGGETLCVCDLFLFPRHGCDTAERGLAAFKGNYGEWHRKPPEVHCGPSHDAEWGSARFRFVHIDGDHSHNGAALDIADSLRVTKAHGLVVIDDYCHPDFPGVAAAAWEAVRSERLFPFAATPSKLYCALNRSDARAWQTTFLTKSPWKTLGRPGIHPDSESGIDSTTVYGNPIMIIPPPDPSGLRVFAKRYLPSWLIDWLKRTTAPRE
jgi:hypothetical protein